MNRMLASKPLRVIMLMQCIFGSNANPDIQGPGQTAFPTCNGVDGYAKCASEPPESRTESVAAPSVLQRDSQIKHTLGADDEVKPSIIVPKDPEGDDEYAEKDAGVEMVVQGVESDDAMDANSTVSGCKDGTFSFTVGPENAFSTVLGQAPNGGMTGSGMVGSVTFKSFKSKTAAGLWWRDIPDMPSNKNGYLDANRRISWDFAKKCTKDRYFEMTYTCFYITYNANGNAVRAAEYDHEYTLETDRLSCDDAGECEAGELKFACWY